MKRIFVVVCVLAVCCQCAGNRKLAENQYRPGEPRPHTYTTAAIDKAVLDSLIRCSNIDSLYKVLYSRTFYDSAVVRIATIRDTTAPRSAYDFYIRAKANTHVTLLLLDTNRTFIRTLVNDEFGPGFYAIWFVGGDKLEEYLHGNHNYMILRIDDDTYGLQKRIWMK